MPTGLTAKIPDGESFAIFVKRCALNMGYMARFRDQEFNAHAFPKHVKPSTYYERKIDSIKAEILSIKQMDEETCQLQAKQDYAHSKQRIQNALSEKARVQKSYEDMLKKVKQWAPPTPEHNSLKEMMIDQIERSIDFDCNTEYLEKELADLTLLSGNEWKKQKLETLIKNQHYYQEEHDEETKRTERTNRWIKALLESLEPYE